MKDADTAQALARTAPVSHGLLTHDQLMSLRLAAWFGAIEVTDLVQTRQGERLVRHCTLRQHATGGAILQARLVIYPAVLPMAMLPPLENGTALFGQLLHDHGVAVSFGGRTLFHTTHPPRRWGRRHHMRACDGGALICEVEEVLSTEAVLTNLRLKNPT